MHESIPALVHVMLVSHEGSNATTGESRIAPVHTISPDGHLNKLHGNVR